MPWDFIGNERAIAALSRDLSSGGRAHAYLFAGPDQVGKATLALKLAQALNCLDGPSPQGPCGTCDPCHRIASGVHSDVQAVSLPLSDEGGEGRDISAQQIREVGRTIVLSPYEGRTRVVIIDPAAAMSEAGQNVFLKTLEEPPAHAVFVLICIDENHLLETIRSRCRRLEFNLAPAGSIQAALEDRGVTKEDATLLSRLADGRSGWAITAARDPAVLRSRREALDLARSLPSMTIEERFGLAERLQNAFRKERAPVVSLLDMWRGWWRDFLLVQMQAEEGVANVDHLEILRKDAEMYSPQAVLAFIRAIGATRRRLEQNVQPRLAIETLLLETPQPAINAHLP